MLLSLEVMRGYVEPISLPFISTHLVFMISNSFGWGGEMYTPMCALLLNAGGPQCRPFFES